MQETYRAIGGCRYLEYTNMPFIFVIEIIYNLKIKTDHL